MERQVEQLYKPLFLFVRKRINSQEDAEDLTQEVFYKLSRSKNEKINNVRSLVYTIARNTITDYYRKKKIETEDIDAISYPVEFEEESVAEDLSKCVKVFVKALPEEYRAIMTLSELEEIPQKEIAESLDMNYVTVRSKIQRGRKKLKNLFSQCCTVNQGGKGSILDYHLKDGAATDMGCCGQE